MPTLVLAGGERSHLPQDQLRRLAEQITGARLWTGDAGHLIHTEDPAGFLAALREFGLGPAAPDATDGEGP